MKRIRRWWTWILDHVDPWLPLLVAALNLVYCLQDPLCRVMSAYFRLQVQAVFIPLAILMGFARTRSLRATGPPERGAVWRAARRDGQLLLALLALTYLVIALTSHDCRTQDGSVLFWVSVPLSVMFAQAWGVFCGAVSGRIRVYLGLTSALAAALALWAFLVYHHGAGYGSNDLILGVWGMSQRRPVLPGSWHLWGRACLAVQTAVLLGLTDLLLRRRRRPRRATLRQAGLLVLAAAAAIVVFAGPAGLAANHDAVRQELSACRETIYWRCYFDPDHPLAPHHWRRIDWDAHRVFQRLEMPAGARVTMYLFPSDEELERLTGSRSAFVSGDRVYLSGDDLDRKSVFSRHNTVAHELVHAADCRLDQNRRFGLRDLLGWDPTGTVSRGDIEGLAVVFSSGYAVSALYHEELASLLRKDQLPSLSRVMGREGFQSVSESLAYSVSGSFFGFLILEFGLDRFKAYWESLDYEETFGADLAELETQWHRFLQDVPTSELADEAAARKWAKRKSFFSCDCPQVGSLDVPPEERARKLKWWLDPAEARQTFAALMARHPEDLEWTARYVRALLASDRRSRAEALIDSLVRVGVEDLVVLSELQEIKIALRILANDHPGALAVLRDQVALLQDEKAVARRLAVLEHPRLGPELVKIYGQLDQVDGAHAGKYLHRLDPAFGPAYSAAFHYTDLRRQPALKLDYFTRFVRRTEGLASFRLESGLDYVLDCLELQRYDDAVAVLDLVAPLASSARETFALAELRDRLDFERESFPLAEFLPWDIYSDLLRMFGGKL